ncbi:MAG: hypothetical protein ABSC01_14490, partial [Verrucomicrobiota bacterium]
KHTTLWLLLILLLGFGLRATGLMWGQSFSYYAQGDGIEAYLTAVDYARGEPSAQYIGQPNFSGNAKLPGPLWAMFCDAGLRVGGSIESVLWAVILLNTAFIYLAFLLAARTIGFPTALWTALFAATFPWVVHYSVCVYNPDVMPFLGALLFLCLWRVAHRDRSKVIFWVWVLLLMSLQFHMSGLMLIPAVIVVLWLCPTRLNFFWLAGGIVAGLALYAPYFSGEMSHGWANTRGMISGGQGGFSVEALKVVSAPLSFLVNWTLRWVRSPAEYEELGRACFGSFGLFLTVNFLSAVFAAFLIAGAIVGIKKSMNGFWRSPRAVFARSPGITFLTIIFVVPLISSLASGKPFHSRYCLVLLAPLLALSATAATRWLTGPRPNRIFLALLVITTCANIWFVPAMYRLQERRIEHGPLFIPSFHKLEMVYQSLKAHAGKNRLIQVNDAAYLQALPPGDKFLHDADMIRSFVVVREKENAPLQSVATGVAIYNLCRADQVRADDPAVAYREHGIALVAQPATP